MMHARPELNVPLKIRPRFPYRLDGRLPADIEARAEGEGLQPILITEIYRRSFDVLPSTGRGQPLAEMALDRVHLRAPDGRRAAPPYFEVEIERRHGTRRDLTAIAAALRQRFELAPSRESKFSRGLKLLKTTSSMMYPAYPP
jgi:inorganic triphosphatase YgiF